MFTERSYMSLLAIDRNDNLVETRDNFTRQRKKQEMSAGERHYRENSDERNREGMGEHVPREHVTESNWTAPSRR